MNHKQLRNIAIVVIIVFAITVVVYPLIFSTDAKPPTVPAVNVEPPAGMAK